jgi:hypothetical protein
MNTTFFTASSAPVVDLVIGVPYSKLPTLLKAVDCIIDISDDIRWPNLLVYGIYRLLILLISFFLSDSLFCIIFDAFLT